MLKDPNETRQLAGYVNVAYNYKGNVYCYCLDTGEKREMCCGGFEEDRRTLKKLCPTKQYGIRCKCKESCSAKQGIRIKLNIGIRIFTPIDMASYKRKMEYNKRPSIEMVDSRLVESFGSEKHYICGKKKM